MEMIKENHFLIESILRHFHVPTGYARYGMHVVVGPRGSVLMVLLLLGSGDVVGSISREYQASKLHTVCMKIPVINEL